MKNIPVSLVLFSAITLICLSLFEPQKARSQTASPPTAVEYETIAVSAVVPVSEEWISSIAENSKPAIKDVNGVGKKTTFILKIMGVENKSMRNQLVHAHVVTNEGQIASIEEKTDKSGIASFEFTPPMEGTYKIFFTNDTYGESIEIEDSLTIEILREVF